MGNTTSEEKVIVESHIRLKCRCPVPVDVVFLTSISKVGRSIVRHSKPQNIQNIQKEGNTPSVGFLGNKH